MCSQKNSPASAHERRCGLCDGVSRLQRAAGLCPDTPTTLANHARPSASQAGAIRTPPCACGCMRSRKRGLLWLSSRAYPAQARGLEAWPQPGLSLVLRRTSGPAQMATAPRQGSGKSNPSGSRRAKLTLILDHQTQAVHSKLFQPFRSDSNCECWVTS